MANVQVTDTPGLLNRRDADRNAMERLTLACMAHLPTSILFVMDLTGAPTTPVQLHLCLWGCCLAARSI